PGTFTPLEDFPRDSGIVGRTAAGDVLWRNLVETELMRGQPIFEKDSALGFRNERTLGERNLIQPVHPVDDETMLRPEMHEYFAQQFRQARLIDHQDLHRRPRRIETQTHE